MASTEKRLTEIANRFDRAFQCALTSSIGYSTLEWLLDENPSVLRLENHTRGVPVPAIGLTESKHISISWTGKEHLLHAEIDRENKEIYWHSYERKTSISEDGVFSIVSETAWDDLRTKRDDVFLSSK